MIKVEIFRLEHLDSFQTETQFEDLGRDMARNLLDINKSMLSMIKDEKTIAILGVSTLRPGAGELWLMPSIHVNNYKFEFFKITKKLIYGYVFPHLEFHRLEIAILKDWAKGNKWAKKLGFDFSHICDHYDKLGRDHIIYKKVVM